MFETNEYKKNKEKAALPCTNQVSGDLSAATVEQQQLQQAAKGSECPTSAIAQIEMEVDEMDLGPNGKTSALSPEEEEKLLTSPSRSISSAKTEMETEVKKMRLSGAARKRLRYHLGQGHSVEAARQLAQQPMNLKRQRSSSTTPKESSPKRANLVVRTTIPTEAEGAKAAVPNPEVNEGMARMSYKDAACSTKLGIIPPDYTATIWPTDKLKAIQHVILDTIRKKQTGNAKPIFNGCTFRPGYIVVSCGNEETTNWLKAAMPKLVPWKDAQVKVVLEKDIPRPLIFTCYFPELDSIATEDILNLLDGQNSGLNVQEWRVLHRVQKGKVTELTIAIDPISAIEMKKYNYWLNYGFSTVQFRAKAKSLEKDAEPEAPKPPALQQTEEQPCTSASVIAVTAVSVMPTDEQPHCSKDAPHATKPAPMTSAQRVEEGIRMRPPLRADKRNHGPNRTKKGESHSAEEEATGAEKRQPVPKSIDANATRYPKQQQKATRMPSVKPPPRKGSLG